VPNSNISLTTQTSRSVVLSNSGDPLSLVSLQEQTRLQNDSNRTFIKAYSAADRLITLKSPLNRVIYQRLNDKGLMSQLQVGGQQPTGFAYDAHGNLASMVQGSRQTQFTYDAHGNLASTMNPMGRLTKYTYDDANRVIEQTSSLGNVIRMTYDKNGNVTSVLPPGRPAHQFFYNLFELVQSYLPPALTSQITGATTYSYNLDKQIMEIHRPDGRVLTFGYLPRGVLWYMSGDGGVDIGTELTSDRITDISSRDETLDYTYAGSLILSVTSSDSIASKVNYGYNTDGTLASISVDGGLTENLAYDRDGLITKVKDISLQRDNVGNISATTLGKVSEAVKFNEFGEIAEDSFVANQKKLFGLQFTRNAVGQITSRVQTGIDSAVQSYEYSSEGRLTRIYSNNVLARTYTYDANGNRLSMTDKTGTINAAYNDQDQLIKYGSTKYTYAANGERNTKTVNGKRTTYGYNALGELKDVQMPGGKQIYYLTDGQRRRIGKQVNGKTVQGFVYQSQTQIIAELDGTGKIIKQFIYGSKPNVPDYMITNGKKYRIVSDQVGTPKMIIDADAGTVVSRMHYDEFGIRKDGKPCAKEITVPFGFAGGLADDDTGLVHFGARDYDPVVGRWLQRDPILFGGGDSNLFSYVAQDPVNLVDASGLATDLICRPVGGLGGSLGGMHCFLRITPEAGSSLGAAPITLSLLTPDMKVGNKYINASVDAGSGTFRAAVDNGQCNTPAAQDKIDQAILASFNRQPNGTPYSPIPYGEASNSNAFIHRVLQGAGLTVIPSAPFGAVGY
jgi:RHS repeat-associated protein